MNQPGREERFRQLQRRYLDTAAEEVAELGRLLEQAGGVPSGEPGARFLRLAHNLRGSGGSYRFGGITEAAGALEAAAERGDDLDRVSAALAELKNALERARASVEDPS